MKNRSERWVGGVRMRVMFARLAGCLFMTLVLVAQAADALAYIDPGYGALVQQVLLSSLFGAVFLARKTIRRIARRVTSLFSGQRRSPEREQVADSAESHETQQPGPRR